MIGAFNAIYNFIVSNFEEFLYLGIACLILLTILYPVIAFRETLNQRNIGSLAKKIAAILIISTL